jgi:hypothetical protein
MTTVRKRPIMKSINLILKMLGLSLMLTTSMANAAQFYVDASAAPGGDGSSWASAFRYLQDALDQTVSERGDEVWIAAGTYYPDDGANVTKGDRRASFFIKDGVSLYGGSESSSSSSSGSSESSSSLQSDSSSSSSESSSSLQSDSSSSSSESVSSESSSSTDFTNILALTKFNITESENDSDPVYYKLARPVQLDFSPNQPINVQIELLSSTDGEKWTYHEEQNIIIELNDGELVVDGSQFVSEAGVYTNTEIDGVISTSYELELQNTILPLYSLIATIKLIDGIHTVENVYRTNGSIPINGLYYDINNSLWEYFSEPMTMFDFNIGLTQDLISSYTEYHYSPPSPNIWRRLIPIEYPLVFSPGIQFIERYFDIKLLNKNGIQFGE